MRKQDRHKLIKQLIQNNVIYRQEDFVSLLAQQGIEVTQATISRDVKEMQLIKLPNSDGTYQYSLPTEKKVNTEKKLKRTLKDAYLFANCHNDMCMFKVLPGSGPSISNLIDQMNYPEVFACLSDDDSIVIFAKSAQEAADLQQKLLQLIEM